MKHKWCVWVLAGIAPALLLPLFSSAETGTSPPVTTSISPPADKSPGQEKTGNTSGEFNPEDFLTLPGIAPQPMPLRRKRSMRAEKALGTGINMLGPSMNYGSAYLQYSVGRVFQAEAGIDLSTVYGGICLYPMHTSKIQGLAPYMGLMIGYADSTAKILNEGIYAYMPVGMRYLAPDRWFMSFELAATTSHNIRTGPLFAGLKLGYLFRL
jgi:hypothetical protein